MSISETLFQAFKHNTEALDVVVLRSANSETAAREIIAQIGKLKAGQVVSTPLNLLKEHIKTIGTFATANDVDFSMRLDRHAIEQADVGISEFELGIAQTGSLFQDASDLHARLVSMLPPVHLALLPTGALVNSLADALEKIETTYGSRMPAYLSFITGPSKTADIERELTVGVHGPGKLVIICIDSPG